MRHMEPAPKYRRTRPDRVRLKPPRTGKRKITDRIDDDEAWQWHPDQTSRDETECCKCEATKPPMRTVQSNDGFSQLSLWLSCIMTGVLFGALLEILRGLA